MAFFFVDKFGVDVPYGDEWRFVQLLEKYYSDDLTFSDLWAIHNEHIILFPKLVKLSIASLTSYSSRAEMKFLVFLFCSILLILTMKSKDEFNFEIKAIPIWFVPVPFLVLSWMHFENMLTGFQITFVMPLVFSIISLHLIDRIPNASDTKTKYALFIISIFSAIVASYSTSSGLFVWISGLLMFLIIVFAHPDSILKRFMIIWSILGLMTIGIYLNTSFSKMIEVQRASNTPLEYLQFFLAMVGAMVSNSHKIAILFGAICLILCMINLVFILRKKKINDNRFFLSISSYSLAVLAAITFSRTHFGIDFAFASRYMIISLLFVFSIYFLSLKLSNNKPFFSSSIKYAMFLVFIYISYSKYTYAQFIGWNLRNTYGQFAQSILDLKENDTDFRDLYSSKYTNEELQRIIHFLKRNNLNVFKAD